MLFISTHSILLPDRRPICQNHVSAGANFLGLRITSVSAGGQEASLSETWYEPSGFKTNFSFLGLQGS